MPQAIGRMFSFRAVQLSHERRKECRTGQNERQHRTIVGSGRVGVGDAHCMWILLFFIVALYG